MPRYRLRRQVSKPIQAANRNRRRTSRPLRLIRMRGRRLELDRPKLGRRVTPLALGTRTDDSQTIKRITASPFDRRNARFKSEPVVMRGG